VSTGDGFGNRWGRNGEFCVAIDPVTGNAGALGYCMLALLSQTLAGCKVKGDEHRFSRFILSQLSVCAREVTCVIIGPDTLIGL